MASRHPDPLGVEQFEFIEFAAPDPALLHELFRALGFSAVARHRSRPVTLYRQGGIQFLINETPDSFASRFAAQHGPACTGFGIRVTDAGQAQRALIERGAETGDAPEGQPALDLPCIRGIGGSRLYLTSGIDDLERDFEFDPALAPHPTGAGLYFIDHLTHNVHNGHMRRWAEFYEQLFGFHEVKYFDIKGAQTGLRSQAMTAP
ncbi:MAG: 4-hydroxyphenylpyruvate dioxygenase family protein, partial [Wenzhouxiangellaceae bacterium]